MLVREETAGDETAIRNLTHSAFLHAPHSNQKEADIVDGLRLASALTVSLIAEEHNDIVGHVAFSPVLINGEDLGWYGLGPVSVLPERQGQGIGSTLIREGLSRLQETGAKGCVLLGDQGYYQRFGFKADDRLKFPGVPAEYFQCLSFNGEIPIGEVSYHAAFNA